MGRKYPIMIVWTLSALIFLLAGFPAFAIQKYSFRMRSLGPNLSGFIDDLYSDLYYNPAYVYRFNKHHIYTNLSNLQGNGQTRLFGDENTTVNKDGIFPSNLAGYAGPVFGGKWGVFWENSGHNFKLTDFESYDDPITAAVRGERTRAIDGSFSGQGLSLFGLIKGIGFNVTYDRVGMDLNVDTQSDSLFYTTSDSSLMHNALSRERWKFPNNMWGVSIGKVWREHDHEWSLSAGIQPHRLNLNMDQLFNIVQVNLGQNLHAYRKPFGAGSADTTNSLLQQQLGFSELGVRSYFARARFKEIHVGENSFYQLNYLLDYSRYSVPLDISTSTVFRMDSLIYANDLSTRVKEDGIFPGDGDVTLNNVTFGIGGEGYLDNLKTMISMGVKLTYIWGGLHLTQGPGRIIHSREQKLDTTTVAGQTYSRTITDNTVVTTKGDTRWLTLSLPVGLELRPHDKLTLRMGANTTIPISFKGTWSIATRDSASSVIDTTGAPPPLSPGAEPPPATQKSSGIRGKFFSLTSYYYGASFRITPSIEMELMNFAQVTDLRTWWLSIVLKF